MLRMTRAVLAPTAADGRDRTPTAERMPWRRNHSSRSVTAGSGGKATVTVAGPFNQTGGVTLPSITT